MLGHSRAGSISEYIREVNRVPQPHQFGAEFSLKNPYIGSLTSVWSFAGSDPRRRTGGSMVDVVTFGEAMIRVSPPGFQRLEQTNSLDVQIGGGELNVAVGVSRLGLTSTWVSRLPKNALGRLLHNRVRQAGVDTSHLTWAEDGRLGLYFVEFGAAPRASSVLSDRAHDARR